MREQIIGMITPVMALVFAATFLALWWRASTHRHVLAFAIAYLFFAIGFIATHLLATDSAYVFHVTQAFYTASLAALVWGACHRAGRPAYLGAMLVVYGVAAATLAVAVSVSNDVAPRLFIVNVGYGVMMVIGVVALLAVPKRTIVDTLILALLCFNALDFLVRPVLTLLAETHIPAAEYRQSIYYSIITVALALKIMTTAIVLLGACIFDLIKTERDRSERDPITGMRNRRAFEHDIMAKLAAARADTVPASLVVADIDHFKQVNDLWGHQAGDEAIAAFGKLIDKMIREQDVSGRIGGEEFCVLVWDCSDDAAHKLADRIRMAFGQLPIAAIGDEFRLTASFGVAELRAGDNYDALFARADAALYDAKQAGRDRVVTAVDRRDVANTGGDPGHTIAA